MVIRPYLLPIVGVRLDDDTVWLTQAQMGKVFAKGRSTIAQHIQNVFTEGELIEKLVCREFRHTTQHGAFINNPPLSFMSFFANQCER
jgi:hypothetical protein